MIQVLCVRRRAAIVGRPLSASGRRRVGPRQRSSLSRLLAALALFACADAWPEVPAEAGVAIYRLGVLPSGAPLAATRDAGEPTLGAAAACVNCHRRSGLGTVEGQSLVPPIIGKYLFNHRQLIIDDPDIPHIEGYVPNRSAYTDATLAAAIRAGVTPDGRRLSYLMPRYALDDASMRAVIGYLRTLGSQPTPGVSNEALEFATVVTPDADPDAKAAMLEVLRHFIEGQNKLIAGGTPPMQANRAIMYRVTRRWNLQVWELTGPAARWPAQLKAKYTAHPVFAILSGLGGRDWAPVHRFCESNGIPCLLPNVDLPVVAESDFYPVYFSRGVLLEADLIAARLGELGSSGAVRRVVQVFASDDIGNAAAAALAGSLRSGTLASELHALPGPALGARLPAILAGLKPEDALVLWLRNGDVATLPASPPASAHIFLSGLMADMENTPLPSGWRDKSRLSYVFDLPDARRSRLVLAHSWLRIHGVPPAAERVQIQTYLACVIVAETLGHMLDSFVRDFLNERLEMMVSRRLTNAYWPRLGLAPGQRFASKGGYLVRLADPDGPRVVADGEWVVP